MKSDTDLKCPKCKVDVEKGVGDRYSCPKCKKEIRWDSRWGFMTTDEIAYKEWPGISIKLKQMFRDAAEGKWEADVCSQNLYTLAGMVRHEMKMIGMLLDDLREAQRKYNGQVYNEDVESFEKDLNEWRGLCRMAAKRAGHIPEVVALDGV